MLCYRIIINIVDYFSDSSMLITMETNFSLGISTHHLQRESPKIYKQPLCLTLQYFINPCSPVTALTHL